MPRLESNRCRAETCLFTYGSALIFSPRSFRLRERHLISSAEQFCLLDTTEAPLARGYLLLGCSLQTRVTGVRPWPLSLALVTFVP